MAYEGIRELWTPTGLILGFQVTFFKWRLEREVGLDDKARHDGGFTFTYLVPSDYLSIAGMLCFVFAVILLPISGLLSTEISNVIAAKAFGLGVLLFVGQALGLAGHYDMYNTMPRSRTWFPTQEKIVVLCTTFISILYLWLIR